jgi:REP element-mobilizing transposase RayT
MLRIQFAGAIYHIFSRGDFKQDIFRQEDDKAYFLRLLRTGAERYGINIFTYCLMNNHYHLSIRISSENLPEFMHYLGSSYANYLVRGGWLGHVFSGRYKSICVKEEEYFLIVNRYIHLNPVEAAFAGKPEEYAWSNYCQCVDGGNESWIEERWLEEYFGPGLREARLRYRQFVEAAMGMGSSYPENEVVAQALLGSEDFVRRIKASIREKEWPKDVIGRRDLERIVSLKETYEAVCHLVRPAGLECGDYRHDEDYRHACFVLIDLAREYTPASYNDIAELLGGISGNAVAHRFLRMKERIAKDSMMHAKVDADKKRIIEALKRG